jgi:AAHS family 4-hydroxybenzoate transporter-like MFS transporter
VRPSDREAGAFDVVEGRLSQAGWPPNSRIAIIMATMAVVLDGFDNQLLGIIIPAIMKNWSVGRDAFAPVAAGSLIGMCVGTALAGPLGDRLGRRPMLIASVLFFGVGTLLCAAAPNVLMFGVLRTLAALGLGGAMPIATALLAESAPSHRRSLIVTLGIVGVPIGGFLAGTFGAWMIPQFGWQTLVIVGGLLPLVAGALMWRFLAEPSVKADTLHAEARTDRNVGIFHRDFARDTVTLWTAFFSCLLAVYAIANWLPTLMAEMGFGLGIASAGLAAFNFGGIFGAFLGAVTMDRRGSRLPLAVAAVMGVAATIAVATLITSAASDAVIVASLAIQGFFVTGLQIMLFALAASVYPAVIRATGVGAALAVGRLGGLTSALGGPAMLNSGSATFLFIVTGAVAVCGASLLLLRRHIPAPVRSSHVSERRELVRERRSA